ncbi:hypothetical protein CO083_04285 [Candidatus Roizmanbacteria bacterium CG_4_9_14_0_8_um_filter_34_12]|uniref:Glycosyl hydrolases family 39 N-terminal catalytic domain-containing protein n=2 Tax=Candidatus Roizmaniibacteriota TaxID=1752723 RepID=A0A2M8DC42_9BACT|nr:MAG: hypothetical protein CO083_04285 [Candidatus Roizmanbacteria bacterium CG_4_9_14_0_8_um_filter_34_12]
MKRRLLLFIIFLPILFVTVFLGYQFYSRATSIKANIIIDTTQIAGPIPDRWKALAQGGEEMGVRMLENVVPQVAELYPRYIRLDHIYDFYDVVSRDANGQLSFNWAKLDETVCDIYHTGAKPFFSLGYMPPTMSENGSLIDKPKNWNEWSLLVQKTIEHYSGINTRLCGQIYGRWLTDIYYEVWNEPDLESFGKWSIYGGSKDYKTFYKISVNGANQAKDVYHFLIGGPVTTALYKNWFQRFLDFTTENNLRVDFLSWHHYSKNANDFVDDMHKLNDWLSSPQYSKYRALPKIISEWGFDSDPNPIADTETGAAHTIASIRNFIEENFELAFLFEIKDGPTPRWGILRHKGEKTQRYKALQMLNSLDGNRIKLSGEGTFVTGLASINSEHTSVLLVNYDLDNRNTESVPVTFTKLFNGNYSLSITYLDGNIINYNFKAVSGQVTKEILMPPNSIVSVKLK